MTRIAITAALLMLSSQALADDKQEKLEDDINSALTLFRSCMIGAAGLDRASLPYAQQQCITSLEVRLRKAAKERGE